MATATTTRGTIVVSDSMEPMDVAWELLKASRQTELGEHHPYFPSSYGPMTMISLQPTQAGLVAGRSNSQPYESYIHQGMKGKPVSQSSIKWEKDFRVGQPYIKPFTFEQGDKGNWFRPARQDNPSWHEESGKRPENQGWNAKNRWVGVRMPLDESMGMFRDEGYAHEIEPEAFIYGDIPPERLVAVPPSRAETAGAWPDGLGEFE